MGNSSGSAWRGKRVLVTGAGGFIGSHLCEALAGLGAEVTAMIRYSSRSDWGNLEFLPPQQKAALKVVSGNVEDAHFVGKQVAGKDVVFHLAALIGIPYSYVAPLSYVRTNVEGTVNVVEAAQRHGVSKVVHTSTSEVYGTARYTPIDEKHPLQPQSPYSASKIAADALAESFFNSFQVPVAIARPFNTFGPRQSARAVIPTIISQALSEKSVRLGNLKPIRDLNYVKDTVQGFIRIAEEPGTVGKTINLGRGSGISVGDLAKEILAILKINKPIEHDDARERPPTSEVFELICHRGEAERILNWKPKFSLEEGLRETVEFVSKNMNLYKPATYAV